jgi:hypothetical protein
MIDLASVRLDFSANVFASLRQFASKDVASFEDALLDIVETKRAEQPFGNPDSRLHVVMHD